MSMITVRLATSVRRSFRVEQVAGMFDVPLGERVKHELTAEVPGLDEAWTIGAIVGPSGSGKTTLARAAFGDAVYRRRVWARDRAIIDVLGEEGERGTRSGERGAGKDSKVEAESRAPRSELRVELPIKQLTFVLTSVGLGSPPTWLKPYRVLSGGERFRADLVRAMIESGRNLTQRRSVVSATGRNGAEDTKDRSLCASAPLREDLLVVVDEFTGALDRTVAKTTSAALARLLRSQGSGVGGQESEGAWRLVAVTCHRDILPWLSPDWTVELGG